MWWWYLISQLKKNQFSKLVERANAFCKAWEFLGSFPCFRFHLDSSLNDPPPLSPLLMRLAFPFFKGASGKGKLHNSCWETEQLWLIQVGLLACSSFQPKAGFSMASKYPSPGCASEAMKGSNPRRCLCSQDPRSSVHSSQALDQPRHPSTDEWLKKTRIDVQWRSIQLQRITKGHHLQESLWCQRLLCVGVSVIVNLI